MIVAIDGKVTNEVTNFLNCIKNPTSNLNEIVNAINDLNIQPKRLPPLYGGYTYFVRGEVCDSSSTWHCYCLLVTYNSVDPSVSYTLNSTINEFINYFKTDHTFYFDGFGERVTSKEEALYSLYLPDINQYNTIAWINNATAKLIYCDLDSNGTGTTSVKFSQPNPADHCENLSIPIIVNALVGPLGANITNSIVSSFVSR